MTIFGKIIIGITTTAGFLLFLYIGSSVFNYVIINDMCESYPYKTVVSPNGKYKALIYQFDCGATNGFSTQISILNAEKMLNDEPGNIFRSDGHPEDGAPEILWLDDKHLIIHKRGNNQVYSQEESWGWGWNKIKITYK
jgi:Family of unknown function (DUF5412)